MLFSKFYNNGNSVFLKNKKSPLELGFLPILETQENYKCMISGEELSNGLRPLK